MSMPERQWYECTCLRITCTCTCTYTVHVQCTVHAVIQADNYALITC